MERQVGCEWSEYRWRSRTWKKDEELSERTREGEREMRMMVYSWQPVTVSKVSPVTALACCHTLVACPEPHSSDVQAYTHARAHTK